VSCHHANGLNPLNRILQVDLMAEFQEELGFPSKATLDDVMC
jgi:hypothetical protein